MLMTDIQLIAVVTALLIVPTLILMQTLGR